MIPYFQITNLTTLYNPATIQEVLLQYEDYENFNSK